MITRPSQSHRGCRVTGDAGGVGGRRYGQGRRFPVRRAAGGVPPGFRRSPKPRPRRPQVPGSARGDRYPTV